MIHLFLHHDASKTEMCGIVSESIISLSHLCGSFQCVISGISPTLEKMFESAESIYKQFVFELKEEVMKEVSAIQLQHLSETFGPNGEYLFHFIHTDQK